MTWLPWVGWAAAFLFSGLALAGGIRTVLRVEVVPRSPLEALILGFAQAAYLLVSLIPIVVTLAAFAIWREWA